MKDYRIAPPIYSDTYVVLIQLRDKIISAIERYANKGDELLDYGCGDMPYKPLVMHKIGKYTGADLAENKQADILIGLDSKINMPNEAVDIVLSTQVLEHVISPQVYLSEAHRVLKKQGTLIISTHGFWKYHPNPNDLWRWTSAGLKKQIQDAGFEIVEVKGILGLMATGIQLFQDGLNRVKFLKNRYFYAVLNVFMQTMIRLFEKIQNDEQRNEDAAFYVIVARKTDKQ